jgi:hypothetical protein
MAKTEAPARPWIRVDTRKVHTASQLTLLERLGNDALREDVKARARELLALESAAGGHGAQRDAATGILGARHETPAGGSSLAVLLDQPAGGLVRNVRRRGELARVLAAAGLSPGEFERLSPAGSTRKVLEAAGCDVARVLELDNARLRDVRLLDTNAAAPVAVPAAAGLSAQPQRDALGRVPLDDKFPMARLQHDPVLRQERYERAARASRMYAANRPLFEQDDAAHLGGKSDLVAQLESDAQIARAHQRAQVEQAAAGFPERLNGALTGFYGAGAAPVSSAQAQLEEAVRTPGTKKDKLIALEAALVGGNAAAAPPVPPTGKLDSEPLRFVELIGAPGGMGLMERAGALYTEGKVKSLDEAAMIVQGAGPTASVRRPPAFPSERRELDRAIRKYQLEHGGDYLTALEAVATMAGI